MTSKKLKFGLVIVALCAVSITNAQDKKKPDPEKMFASYDTDEDKLISLDEFKTKKRKKEMEAAVLEKRFAKIDADSNGTLTLDEFKAGMAKGKDQGNNKKKKKSE
ncbi:EF-hand domain-containing protein [Algibacter sp. L4_22]|uniref:EF-hand domain-containing protein n=1 Tax=Algibacter sp. L4_22 TaxID=2942477 RepID=UPI00201B97DE|nr:EF-hand domain-containing protein [Algibacter sp. L4_22]MCL5130444.1 EF-hand domain-containing protein [Algibacter sp. L4_22]